MTNWTEEEWAEYLREHPEVAARQQGQGKQGGSIIPVSGNARQDTRLTKVKGMAEGDFQVKVIKLLQEHGWLVCEFRKARIKKGGHDVYRTPFGADGVGFPDLVAVKGKRCLFIECKSEHGRLRIEQEGWLIRLMNLETDAIVLRPSDLQNFARGINDEVHLPA